jgi:hypothetical protein
MNEGVHDELADGDCRRVLVLADMTGGFVCDQPSVAVTCRPRDCFVDEGESHGTFVGYAGVAAHSEPGHPLGLHDEIGCPSLGNSA